MGTIENIKVGDLVVCHYQFHVGIGYAKVTKIFDCEKGREVEEYGPVIKHHGDNNSKLDITVQILGYDLRDGDNEDDLGEIIEVNEIKVFNPNDIYRIITEDEINRIKGEWETLMRDKLNFLYKNVNRPPIGGRKIISSLKF